MIRAADDFLSFDPADAWATDAIIARNIFSPLVRYTTGAGGGQKWGWENQLLDRHSVSNDGLDYTFVLRDEAWAGGDRITAADVAFSLDRIMGRTQPVIRADNAQLLSNVAAVKVVDDLTVAVKLKRPDTSFILNVMALVAGCVVPQAYTQKQQDGKLPRQPEQFSGRYGITELYDGDHVTLCAQDSWRGGQPRIKTVMFLVVRDDMAAQQMFKSGQLHVYRVGRDVFYNVADSMQQTEAQLFFASTSRVAMATINPNSQQLASTELRRALQQVINIDAARAAAYGTIARNAPGGVIAPGWPGGDIDRRIEFSPGAADDVRAALAGPLRIRSSGDPVMRRLTEAVAAQLGESGIETELLEPNGAALFQDLLDGAVDMTIQRSSAAFEAEDGLRFDFAYAERANPELASLGQQDLTNNIETRVAYQRLLLDMGAVLPVAEDCNVYYVAPGIAPDFSPDGEIGDLGNWDFG